MVAHKYDLFLRQLSVVSVFEQLDPNLIPLDETRAVLLDIFGTDSKPLVSQFPDILAIILPQHQINILAEGKRLLIADSKSGELGDRKITDFLKAAHKLNTLVISTIKVKMTTYGFNFHSKVVFGSKGSKIDSAKQLTKLSISNPGKLSKLLKAKLTGGSFRAIYERDQARFDLRITPDFRNDLSPSPKASVGCNVHFASTQSFPKYSMLLKRFKELHKTFESDIRAILVSL